MQYHSRGAQNVQGIALLPRRKAPCQNHLTERAKCARSNSTTLEMI